MQLQYNLIYPSETKLIIITYNSSMSSSQPNCLILGYYQMRAKGQVCRLLCEYLHINYQNKFFTPEQWQSYQQNQAKNWKIKSLPFLKDGDFVVTGTYGIIEYIIRKSGNLSLLGNSIHDKLKISQLKSKPDIKDNVLALICKTRRSNSRQNSQRPLEHYWKNHIEPRLIEIEAECSQKEWFLGYISIIDFVFYEMMNNIIYLFPNQLLIDFPKLMNLRNKVYSLEAIEEYQNSPSAIKIYNPVTFYKKIQREKEHRAGVLVD